MKNRNNRLLSAVIACFLLIGTAGAWFALGKNATVNGISVKMAEGSSGGIILNTSGIGGNPGETLTLNASALSLNPCTTADTITFYSVKNGVSAQNSNDGEVDNLTTSNLDIVSGDSYYAEHWIYVKSADETTYNTFSVASITISGDGADDEINKALRIGVIYGDIAKIYAPVSGASDNYSSFDGNKAAKTVTLNHYGEAYTGGTVGTSYKQIMIFIWYEGQDAACTTANQNAVTGNVEISITFSAE